MKKRIIAMVLSVAMMLTMFPTGVLADDFVNDKENTAGVTVSAEGQSNDDQGEERDIAQVNVDEDEETQPETVQPENEQTEPEQAENDQTEPTQNETDQAKPDQTVQPEPGSTVPDQAGTTPDDKQPEPEQPATDPAENGVSDGAESTEGEQAESKTEFTVTWESEGETILTKTFAEGTSKDEVENAQPAEDPVKEADGDVAYEFAGWTPDYADVTADQTYTAKFEEVEQDEMVSTASLVEPAADKGSRSVEVDGTITLSSGGDWSRNHKWSSENSTIATVSDQNSSQTTVTGVSAGETVIRHTYEQWEWNHMSYVSRSDTWTITVNAPVAATGVELKTQDGKTGEAEVTEFQTLTLVATPVPNNATGTYQWHSDKDEVLSVQGNGNTATGAGKVRIQSAKITVQFTPTAGEVQQAEIQITVKPDEEPSSTAQALVYYLIDPNGDVNSNNKTIFGDRYGEVTVNTAGMVWNADSGRNCTTSDVKNRVVDWPDGYKVVEPQSSHWYAIFNKYKATVENELGVTIEEKDVEEIRIIPAKISQNNGTNPDCHVDCNVKIVCGKVATVKYYLQDVGDDTPKFLGSKNYITGRETKPSDVTDKTFPGTKDQGVVTYTFKGWYTDPSFTNGPVSMPQTVNGSTDYYAKYVAGRSVTYDLDGGTWNLGSQNNWTEQVDEGFLYTVKGDKSTQLQRTGYTFAGWKVDGESIDGKTEFNAGEKFTMPGRNVTLKAKWDKDATKTQPTQYTVKYTINGVEQSKDTIVVTGTAWVNENPAKIAIAKGGISAPADKYKGYKLENPDLKYPAEGEKVESGSVYTVNYVKDDAQTQPTQYTVKYTINGVEQSNDTIVVTGTAWVNENPAKIAIAKGGIPAPANKYEGYKLDEQNPKYPAEGTEVKSGSEYTVNYVNRTDLSYTVHYYWKDTTDEVAPSKNVTGQTFGASVTETPKDVEGCTAVNPEEEKTFSIGVTNEAVIFYYYKNVTVTADDKSKTYGADDPELTATVKTVTGPVSKDTVKYALNREAGKDVGTYAITPSGEAIQGNYMVTYKPGTLTITPVTDKVTVTITGNTKTVTYDGKEHTVDGYSVSIDNALYTEADFAFSGEAKVENTDAGTYPMGLKAEQFQNTSANFTNVKFSVEDGWLKINPYMISIEPTVDKPFLYNGKEPQVEKYTIDGEKPEGLLLDHKIASYETYGSGVDVGEYDRFSMNNAKIVDGKGNDVTANYWISYSEKTMTITPAPLTVTTEGGSKVYDGKPLTNEVGSIAGFVNGETATLKTTGSQTNVGTSDNTYVIEWGTAKVGNYKVTQENLGKLEVTAQSINPTPDPEKPDEKDPAYGGVQIDSPSDSVYDGTEHKWVPTVLDKDGNALTDADYKVTYSTDNFTDATGTITVTITGAGNYTGTVTRTYKITPASLKITTNSAEQT